MTVPILADETSGPQSTQCGRPRRRTRKVVEVKIEFLVKTVIPEGLGTIGVRTIRERTGLELDLSTVTRKRTIEVPILCIIDIKTISYHQET